MSNCCNDPTEPSKVDPRELRREQEHFGNLVRDLFTEDPERVILGQLNEASTYLRELAAMNAHHASVRKRAIDMLGAASVTILEQIITKDPDSEFAAAAQQRLNTLSEEENTTTLGKLFNKLKP